MEDAEAQRVEILERWERAAVGWSRRAQRLRETGMPVSVWMIEHLELQPGRRVLELAAGPGDTGFLAAELIRQPDGTRAGRSSEAGGRAGGVREGTLICSDAVAAMLEVARARASELGIDNVEFRRLELEWIDLPTASVDAALCRWGLMLSVDPAAALQEARRVLRPGGRVALAVWDTAERNPWATIPGWALVELGHASPPDPHAPGMFALAEPGRLQQMLESAGFVDVLVDAVDLPRSHPGVEQYLQETVDLSPPFAEVFQRLTGEDQADVRERIAALARPFTGADGSVHLPGSSLVAVASA